MSSSVAKARGNVGDTGENVAAVTAIGGSVEDLEALSRAGDHDVLA
jgi:hypothetical protein